MRLADPGDFKILEYLQDGRNVAGNIHLDIDVTRGYVNSELPKLADYGLVRKIGPNPNSGLYELTEKGELAIEYRHVYHQEDIDFNEFLEKKLEERQSQNT